MDRDQRRLMHYEETFDFAQTEAERIAREHHLLAQPAPLGSPIRTLDSVQLGRWTDLIDKKHEMCRKIVALHRKTP